jgi:hypothetical protein
MVMYNGLFSADGKKMISYIPQKPQSACIIPDCVTHICQNAFEYTRFKSLTIPSSVVYIGSTAFGSVFGLEDVYFNGTKSEWEQIEIRENNPQLQKAKIHFSTLSGYTK